MSILLVETIRRMLQGTVRCPKCGHRQYVPKDRDYAELRCEKCNARIFTPEKDRDAER